MSKPGAKKHPKRVFGAYKGQIDVPDSFFEPLPEEELAAWEGAYDSSPLSDEPHEQPHQADRPKKSS